MLLTVTWMLQSGTVVSILHHFIATMELFHQRIENTTQVIKSFKTDQERLILKSKNDMSAKFKLTKSLAGTGRLNGSRVSINEGSITNMLNIDCIIMPHCQEASSYKKLWPQSLIVNRSNNCAEVGQIESHGSLWKLIPCNDAAPGSRIMLQTAVSTLLDVFDQCLDLLNVLSVKYQI